MTKLSEDLLIFYDEDVNDEVDQMPSSASPKTLKIDVKTRWHSQLTMIESSICQNKNVINVMLQSINKGHLILLQTEYSLLIEICQFLKHFKKITTIFCVFGKIKRIQCQAFLDWHQSYSLYRLQALRASAIFQ